VGRGGEDSGWAPLVAVSLLAPTSSEFMIVPLIILTAATGSFLALVFAREVSRPI